MSIVWNCELNVDIAAASRVSMNRITKRSGIELLMYSGIIRSVFPFATAIEMRFWVL